jgi:hypothetical protein
MLQTHAVMRIAQEGQAPEEASLKSRLRARKGELSEFLVQPCADGEGFEGSWLKSGGSWRLRFLELSHVFGSAESAAQNKLMPCDWCVPLWMAAHCSVLDAFIDS